MSSQPIYYLEDYPEMKELHFANQPINETYKDIDILIGNDFYGHLITGEMIKSKQGGLIAMESKFGWLLSGPLYKESKGMGTTLCFKIETSDLTEESLQKLLPKFWDTDVLGITNEVKITNTNTEHVLEKFRENLKYNKVTGRYSVRLPWKKIVQSYPQTTM